MTFLPDDPPPAPSRPFNTEAQMMLDAEGNIAFWSAGAREIFGYTADEIVGRPLSDIIPELASDAVAPRNTTGLRRDGTRFLADVHLEQWSGEGGDLAAVRVSDVLARQVWTATYHEVYITLTSLLACCAAFSDAAPLVLDALAQALGWNAGAMWLPVEDRSAMAACAFSSVRPMPELRGATSNLLLRRGEGLPGRVWESGEAEWVEQSGSDPWFLRASAVQQSRLDAAIAFPILDGTDTIGVIEFFAVHHRRPDTMLLELMLNVGSLIGMFIVRDRALVAVRESEERYRRLVRVFDESQAFAHVGSFEWNLANGTMTWSEELYRIAGRPLQADPLPADRALELVHPDERENVRAAIRHAVRTGEPLDVVRSCATTAASASSASAPAPSASTAAPSASSARSSTPPPTRWRCATAS
jgi:PAS domain S-box-containing protein